MAHADVLTESGGRSKGCGIVEFTSAADAERAIRTMQDTELLGRRILVREDRDAPGSGREAAPSSGGRAASSSSGVSVAGAAAAVASTGNPRVYVGNLSWDVEWQGESAAGPGRCRPRPLSPSLEPRSHASRAPAPPQT